MLNRFINFILTRRLLVGVATAVLMLIGIIAWRRLPVDAFPDVTNVQVMILTEAPGLAPEQVDAWPWRQVSRPALPCRP